MPVLDYAASSRPRFSWWQWGIAGFAGAFGGWLVAVQAYDLMLPALARDMQVTIYDVQEPFRRTMAFGALHAFAGILIALLAMFGCRFTRRNLLGPAALLLIVFTVGYVAGFVYERYVWTPRNSRRVAVGLAEVPVFTAPVLGCIAVICVAATVAVRRRLAERPAA